MALVVLLVTPALVYWGFTEWKSYRIRGFETEAVVALKSLATAREAYHVRFNRYTADLVILEACCYFSKPPKTKLKLVVATYDEGQC